MYNASVMGMADGICDLCQKFSRLSCLAGACRESIRQRYSFDEIANNVERVRLMSNFVDGDNSRVAKLRCRTRFPNKQISRVRIRLVKSGKLNRNDPVEL